MAGSALGLSFSTVWMKAGERPVSLPVIPRETSIRRPAGCPPVGITYCCSTPSRAAAVLRVGLVVPPSDQITASNRRIDSSSTQARSGKP